jgi:hypothetical protein
MPIIDASYSALQNIINEVRTITFRTSVNQISDAQIIHIINIFTLYRFPEDIKLFNLKKTLTFYTNPYVDIYDTETLLPNDPLYNFSNEYTFSGDPVYVNGLKAAFLQDRTQLFNLYPFIYATDTIGSGDGVNTFFAGTFPNNPCLMNNVLISSVDTVGNGISIIDVPFRNPTTGYYESQGYLADSHNSTIPLGTIDYINSIYSVTLPIAPAAGQDVTVKTSYYNPSIPRTVLFFDKQFTIRPVPDSVYAINLEVYKRPDALLNTTQMPELAQHWLYIAYGAALKILLDARDMDTYNEKLPEFQRLEQEVRTKAAMQLSQQKITTIYDMPYLYSAYNNPFGYRY